MRPIDKETMLDLIIKAKRADPETGSFAEWLAEYLVEHLPTLTPQDEPLTLEQLREMDGEPVYIVFLPDDTGEKLQFWALVSLDELGEVYLMNNLDGSSAYEEVWADIEAIYRRPPERQEDT